jgi:hypothetical protein
MVKWAQQSCEPEGLENQETADLIALKLLDLVGDLAFLTKAGWETQIPNGIQFSPFST